MSATTTAGAASAAPAPRAVLHDQPEHGQVSMMLDGVCVELTYRDWTTGIFTVVWPGGHDERVRFTGRKVCPRCLHHHKRRSTNR